MIGLAVRIIPVALAGYGVAGGKDKLEELGKKAINAAMAVKTSMDMSGMVKLVQLEMIDGSGPPRDFPKYVRENMHTSGGTDPATDAWGGTYRLIQEHGEIWVVSCGPDQQCDTDDDVEALVDDGSGRF